MRSMLGPSERYCLATIPNTPRDSTKSLKRCRCPEWLRVSTSLPIFVQDARFCAGCHDPVPFFTGAFEDSKWDDPKYDAAHDAQLADGDHEGRHETLRALRALLVERTYLANLLAIVRRESGGETAALA